MDWAFYKYSDFSGALHILNGTLKFDAPNGFNDPFDCLPATKPIALDDPILEQKLLQYKKREPSLNEKMEYANLFSDPNYHRNNAKDLRILCLTKNKANLLMWSHYADHHNGCCFEFNFKDHDHDNSNPFQGNNWFPLVVKYRENRPLVGALETRTVDDAVFSKSKDWEYEEEWRIMRIYRDLPPTNNIVEYPRERFLKRVILGCRMPSAHQNAIISLVKDINDVLKTEISIEQASISKSNYELDFKEIKLKSR